MTAPGTKVVLYVCTVPNGEAERILSELREYAARQQWQVVAELADAYGAAAEPGRPQLDIAKKLIEDGEAEGLVTRYPAMAIADPQEQRDLEAWLAERDAWTRVTWQPSQIGGAT